MRDVVTSTITHYSRCIYVPKSGYTNFPNLRINIVFTVDSNENLNNIRNFLF